MQSIHQDLQMTKQLFSFMLACMTMATLTVSAQQTATVRIDAEKTYQRITGFGGFVCSPQFGYNHMSSTDIKKVWGPGSTVGCNIMRLYIPIGKNSWSQSLQTAKTAKQMGLIVFASPWGQPAEWKTNGTSNAKNGDGTLGYLKKENWPDYAQYLEDYVQYLRKNGVELDAISIQNEPDWPATYAGCLWSAADMAEFVKTYGPKISCKVMAPETLAVSDSYANALNKTDVLNGFDIYGGHQYGGIQSAYKNLAKKGKEVWMTEYLINWNENQSSNRNFDFSKDFFNFFRAINVCMQGDFNAWVHYAAKRFYGMLGDGQMGTSNGVVTKRGYVMAHFARFVTGMTRIDANLGNSGLEGTAYLSNMGDTVVAVLANSNDKELHLTIDLPFYSQEGECCITTKARNFQSTKWTADEETCRPIVDIPSQCVATLLFVRSHERQKSDMKGSIARFDRIEDMSITKSSFGNTYQISGKTKTFDHNNPLISSRTNTSNGYVALDNRYSTLIMQVKKISSTLNYSSALTTLTYINDKGQVASHNYGDLEFTQHENFYLAFDISPKTLPDGCRGLLSISNNNWSSTLSITFGDVYLTGASSPYAAQLTGAYVADDSNVLDFTMDANCTSLDMTRVTDLPESLPWLKGNRVVYVSEDSGVSGDNVVAGGVCTSLVLSPDGGDFRPSSQFTANKVALSITVDGCGLALLPFEANVPDGVKAYAIGDDLSLQRLDAIPACTPVLLEAQGLVTFTGFGEVSYYASPLDALLRGSTASMSLYAGDYVLAQQNGQWGFERMKADGAIKPFGVYARLSSSESFIPLQDGVLKINEVGNDSQQPVVYDLAGRRVKVGTLNRGVYVVKGKKVLVD